MRKKRLSNYKIPTRSLKVHRFAGVSLGGSKTDKNAVAILEYYPKHKKLFLRHIYRKIRTKDEESSDSQIYKILKDSKKFEKVAFNAPLILPKCMRCRLKCPGYERCKEPEITWMWNFYRKHKKTRKKHQKIFTPYTERCADFYISKELEKNFLPPPALGTNLSPQWARARFLTRRLKGLSFIEFYTPLTLWRVGRVLEISKNNLNFYKSSIEGRYMRKMLIDRLIKRNMIFIYEQDRKDLIQDGSAFEACLGSFTGFLDFFSQCEKKPKGFPKNEAWVHFPVQDIQWGFLNL